MENDNHEIYGNPRTRGDEDYKVRPKQNHCYGHTPQIQKGAKTSNSGVERMPFVTMILTLLTYLMINIMRKTMMKMPTMETMIMMVILLNNNNNTNNNSDDDSFCSS